ncbi:hypothetical protein ACFOGG_18620 [Brenneria rubrifaciens]|uniref:hypothetical protein n=1 Tax=Brenneria rubrifaciens TaxID=55213 RepID=UPI00361ED3B6
MKRSPAADAPPAASVCERCRGDGFSLPDNQIGKCHDKRAQVETQALCLSLPLFDPSNNPQRVAALFVWPQFWS